MSSYFNRLRVFQEGLINFYLDSSDIPLIHPTFLLEPLKNGGTPRMQVLDTIYFIRYDHIKSFGAFPYRVLLNSKNQKKGKRHET